MAEQFLEGLSVASEEEALESQKSLEIYCNEIELSLDNSAIHKIAGIIRQFDMDIRTVEGYEFDSREKAKIALEEKKSLTIYLEVILLQAKEIICSCFNI